MADRSTVILGNQIKDATVTEDELNASVAGDGISGGAGAALALDINELTGATVNIANDSVAIIDADDSNASRKETIADIMTATAGDALVATAGVLDVQAGTGLEINADTVRIAAAAAGVGLTGGAGSALDVDLNEVSTVAIDVANDAIAFMDNSDTDDTKKTTWALIATAIAGTGITATNGVLSADSVSDNIVEADIASDNFSATTNGVLTDFDLTSIPLSASLQVYINGVYAEEGSGKDYELNPDSGDTKTIRINGDVLATGEKLIAHYIIDN